MTDRLPQLIDILYLLILKSLKILRNHFLNVRQTFF